MRVSPLLLSAAALIGCRGGPYDAPAGSTLFFQPATAQIAKSPAFWLQDLVGGAFFVDVQVQDPDGLPLENIRVYAQAPGEGVALLPRTAVRTVAGATPPENWASIRDKECLDPNGNLVLENELCGLYYDETGNVFYDIGVSYADGYTDSGVPAAGPWAPDYAELVTDRAGFARVWVFVDAMPIEFTGDEVPASVEDANPSDITQGDISIFFSIRVDAESFVVQTSTG
jgi:hypothetical protein